MDLPDFRPQLHQAQDWVADLIDGTAPDQLGRPTPCEEFDVRDLIAHIYKGTMRVEGMGHGVAAENIDFTPDELPDDLAAGYRERVAAARAAWTDDAKLASTVTAPWGEAPGALAVGAYLTEALAHGWDLATATGQPGEIDPPLAELALQVAQRAIPADIRDWAPYGAVISSSAGQNPTEQFVHWMGRATPSAV